MANHTIPRRATTVIADLTALADDGRVVHLRAYRHVRQGHDRPEFYLLWFAERPDGTMDRSTRVTAQYSGKTAQRRLDTELAATRRMFAAARKRNGAPPPAP